MTPTATVCLMSLTANRPRGGKSEKASTHIGLEGISSTIPASPDLMNLGLASVALPGTEIIHGEFRTDKGNECYQST